MIEAHATVVRKDNPLAPYVLLAGLWLVTITIVPPTGNFPLNDDWMYAKVVKHLDEIGRYEASPYADPTFILQAYWGGAFVKVFGFNFETLRASTLVFALVALWAVHWAAREAGLSVRWALLVAITLLVNPLFLNLSYTFMTDVPFLALSTLSGAAYLRSMRTDRLRWIGIATTIGVIAYLVRQFAVVVVIAAFLALLPSFPMNGGYTRRIKRTMLFMGPLLLLGLLLRSLPLGGVEMAKGWDWNRLGDTWIERFIEVARHYAIAFTYLAALVFPIFLAARILRVTTPRTSIRSLRDSTWPHKFRVAGIVALGFLSCVLVIPTWPHRLPNLGNLLYDFGVGPILLPGMLDGLSIAAPFRLGRAFWWVVTAFGIAGATCLAMLHLRAGVVTVTERARADSGRRAELFLALWSCGMLLVLTLPPVLARFDRYFVVAQIPASILLARWLSARQPTPSRIAYVAAATLFVVSIACLQDYLAWNAARWKGLRDLQTAHNVPVDEINGGYEFNGWYLSDRFVEESMRTHKKVFGPLGWWTIEDEYRVSLRRSRHFEVIGREPYFSWLGFTHRDVFLLHRTEPDPNP